MRIKHLHIKNFKSLVDFKLENLPSFGVIVGPNASGKSNIFEALEFVNYICRFQFEASSFFGGKQSIYSFNAKGNYKGQEDQHFSILLDKKYNIDLEISYNKLLPNFTEDPYSIGTDAIISDKYDFTPLQIRDQHKRQEFINAIKKDGLPYDNEFETFIDNFSRIFIGKQELNRSNHLQSRLLPDASNLAQVLSRILSNQEKQETFIENLRILIPEFENIKLERSNIDNSVEFFIYEKTTNKPLSRKLISDGTFNLIALLAAVYQSDVPQFLCIEEPENGLHPQAIQLLVDIFREQCEEHGHHILLNTHSQTLVRCLHAEEIILVNKVNGETIAKQLTTEDNIDVKTDEAWLSNTFGGGVLWSR